MLSIYEITKKKLKLKLLQGLISEETKNCSKKLRREKAGEQAVGETVLAGCIVAVAKALLQGPFFFTFCSSFLLIFDLQC